MSIVRPSFSDSAHASSIDGSLSQTATRETVDRLFQILLGRSAETSLTIPDDSLNSIESWIDQIINSEEFSRRARERGAEGIAKSPDAISTQEFIFPSILEVSKTPVNKMLFIGSCLTTEFTNRFNSISNGIEFDFVLYNNVGDLPDKLPDAPEAYTALLLQIPLRSILTDRVIKFKEFLENGEEDLLLDHALSAIDAMLEAGLKYQRAHAIPAFVTNFIIPSSSIAASLADELTTRNLTQIIRLINDHLARRVSALSGVQLIDLDALAGAMGKDGILDDWFHLFNHNATFFDQWTETPEHPFYVSFDRLHVADFRPSKINEFFALVWRAIDARIRILRQVDQVKLVVFDLDNTLWRGQIAEHYRDGMVPPFGQAWPEGLPEAIHHLRARGILVAICSKNDEEIVRERWDRAIPEGWLELDHFVVSKINWQPKAVNIAEILQETSLTPKSVVFVDDNPLERDAVATAFPDMRIIGENPFLTRSILLRAPETQVAVLTGESGRREGMIRKQIEREHERAVMSRETFLHGLQCSIRYSIIDNEADPAFARAIELINKTNQFNTTGVRWSAAEIQALFHQGGKLIAIYVSDKFTDYGLVGVLILREDLIEQFVMSCRVLGLGIDQAALSVAVSHMKSSGSRVIEAKAIDTKDNLVSRDVFEKSGFTRVDDSYVFDGAELHFPSHITLKA
jgi:FkbH-like protein